MKRFCKNRAHPDVFGLLSLLLTLAVLLLLWFGSRQVNNSARAEQTELLRSAVLQAAVHCYAIEGAYPESLDVLRTRYGLYYDETRFFVDYRCFASNLMPDVTVLARG